MNHFARQCKFSYRINETAEEDGEHNILPTDENESPYQIH